MKSINHILSALLVALALFVTSTPASAQSGTPGIQKIVAAQDGVLNMLTERLTNHTTGTYLVARDVKALADSLIVLQAAEERAYKLADVRDSAPQTMTTTAVHRSLEEAKALGVSRGVRNNILTEWQTARTVDAADLAVLKMNRAISEKVTDVADRGSFRRMLPDWMGGTSSFANYRAPQRTEDAVMVRLQELERRVATAPVLGVIPSPTATK